CECASSPRSCARLRADTIFARRFQRRFPQLRVRGQAEVIVGRQIDDLLAVESAHRFLLVVEDAQPEVRPFLLQLFDLLAEVGKRTDAGRRGSHSSTSLNPSWSDERLRLGGSRRELRYAVPRDRLRPCSRFCMSSNVMPFVS